MNSEIRKPNTYCDKKTLNMEDDTETNMDWVGDGWYRLPEDTIIPNKALNEVCGNAQHVAWINSTHPNKTGMTVDIKICFKYYNKPCDDHLKGKISHCDKFYLYYLRELEYCPSVYCIIKNR